MNLLRVLWKKNMLVAFLMGFSSGLPLLLTTKTLQAWMTKEQVDLKVIGLFALVGLPYTLKFLWSPVFDAFTLPFLGRRRGWILTFQICLSISLATLALMHPRENTLVVAVLCLVISFFSASQDIVIDAYRRETLADSELGIGTSLCVYGYRIAIWVTGGLALIFADHLPWSVVYLVLAIVMAAGIFTTLWAEEPKMEAPPPRTLWESVVLPLGEFLQRQGAGEILLFILLYKVGDTMAGALTTTFYIHVGFSLTEIGAIAKTFGFFSSLTGAMAGGFLILRFGIGRCLLGFGILQTLSTLGFVALSYAGRSLMGLTCMIAFEDFSLGMGTAAFAAYIASQTNRRFTATQYALLSSIMGIPRVILASPTGILADKMGWTLFFLFCTLLHLPGILMVFRVADFSLPTRSLNEQT